MRNSAAQGGMSSVVAPLTPGEAVTLPGMAEVVAVLRSHGARFGYLHGSRARGTAGPGSDTDVAAHFGAAVASYDVLLPPGFDLLVLDDAPLELAGRVASAGVLVFDDDPPARVRWQATTLAIYLDEQPRIAQARADFLAARRGR